MPVYLPTLSRREFLVGSGAAVVGLSVTRAGFSAEGEACELAWLSDTHIPSAPDVTARDVNMTANLRQVVGELRGLKTPPAAVIINGDCAYLKGLPADYANLADCVAPLHAAGMPLHVTMGNHDDRQPLFEALKAIRPEVSPVQSKHVGVIETPYANLFLLDSMYQVDVVTGELGQQQLTWLAKALDERGDKPAVIMGHHNPQFQAPPEGSRWTGLQDTAAFLELLASRKQVRAYVFGHTHNWSISRRDTLHLINLPPVAYVFGAGKPNGWVHARLSATGMTLTLHAIDKQHPQQGERVELSWT